MHSRLSRVLLSCRCLYGPWRQRKAGPLREQFCKGALRAHLVPRNAVTFASITCRGDAHAHDQCGSMTRQQSKMMSSMHRP